MRWFTRLANAPTLQSVITTSPKGNKFFNVMGNTFPIKDELSRLGFKYFKGTWSVFLDKAKTLRPQIEALGIDTSPLDQVTPEPIQQPTANPQPVQKPTEEVELDKTLAQMRKAVDEAMRSGSTAGGVKNILEVVDRELDNLAAMVDTKAKDEVVKAFLQFASKFWNYSMGNQILIWVQRPNATFVSGYKAWLEKGRQVTRWDEAISILAPRQVKVKGPDKKYNDRPDMEGEPAQATEVSTRMYFVPVKVYDISATDPIPGWKDSEGHGPFVPPSLKLDDNDKLEHIEALTDAANRFAQQVGIAVNMEKVLEEQLGGYSSGKNVVVNQIYQGLNRFGTLIHELAHEILHREEDQVTPIREERKAKEIDAETVSYIVLKHYGYESKSAPQYLALWRATGEDMKKRRNQVAKAVKIIIDNVNKQMGKIEAPDEAVATTAMAHWLLSTCKFANR